MRRAILGSLGVLLLAGGAQAQKADMAPPPVCEAVVPPPPEMAGWTKRSAVAAAGKADALGGAMLTPGKGADVTLLPTPQVAYPVRASRPGGSVSSGGLLGFTATQAGTYRVALGSGAWIEVVRDGKALDSTAHSPGPTCTGIRKVVDFALTPGAYVLEIAGNGSPNLPVLVTKLP